MFEQDELNVLLVVLQRANITGKEAMTIALLQQKISSLLQPVEPAVEGKPAKKEDKKA